jgi:hypothetical protein
MALQSLPFVMTVSQPTVKIKTWTSGVDISNRGAWPSRASYGVVQPYSPTVGSVPTFKNHAPPLPSLRKAPFD